MKLLFNGEPLEVPDGLTIRDLLERQHLGDQRVAVEVNRTLIRRARHETHRLAEGDHIEVVTFVGGG